MRVFNDAQNKYGDKFPHPPPGILVIHAETPSISTYVSYILISHNHCVGKFYLVDSGYPNKQDYLGQYKGNKYHLSEFRQGPRPQGSKELFNYYHILLFEISLRGLLKF
jgi:hypothetical protein